MRRSGLHQLPVLDLRGSVVGLEVVRLPRHCRRATNWVVIMAGGLGSRLDELTRETPKPMLKIGSRPLLETIVRSYAEQGFRRFYFAVNYKAEQIESHFGDGAALGVKIGYLREQQRLGHRRGAEPVAAVPTEPIIVTNADLLTKEDYGDMVDRHVASGADATMAVRDYEMQVPFGVVRERDGTIEAIEEKPIQRFVVSAGMYVLSPQVIEHVPANTFFDMPTLLNLSRALASARAATRSTATGSTSDERRTTKRRSPTSTSCSRDRRSTSTGADPGARRLEGPARQEHPACQRATPARVDHRRGQGFGLCRPRGLVFRR